VARSRSGPRWCRRRPSRSSYQTVGWAKARSANGKTLSSHSIAPCPRDPRTDPRGTAHDRTIGAADLVPSPISLSKTGVNALWPTLRLLVIPL